MAAPETLIRKILPGFGIKTVAFSDGLSEEAMAAAMQEAAGMGPVKMVYLETPANPTNAMIDFAAVTRSSTPMRRPMVRARSRSATTPCWGRSTSTRSATASISAAIR